MEVIVTLFLEVAGSLLEKHGLYGYTVEYTYMGSKRSLHMEPSPLPVLTVLSGAGCSVTLGCQGDGGARQGLQYSIDSLEQFLASRPETGAPQCFYPFEVRTQEETGST